MKALPRRVFLKKSALAAGSIPFMSLPLPGPVHAQMETQALEIHLFSKHLQFLSCKEASEIAASLGFEGLDLTVRPNGHVSPARVRDELPEALMDIRSGGSSCKMITTAVEDADKAEDQTLLRTAAGLGIIYYRTNWYHYDEAIPMQDSLKAFRRQIHGLSDLNKKLGLIGCYQNHSGKLVGASPWELYNLLQDTDRTTFGVQYDIRHATVEGGLSWENGLRLLKSMIKSIVLKDFKWGRVNGRWQLINTPIGKGMVDFHRFFKLLKMYGIQVPAVLHLEYPLGGAEHGHSKLTISEKDVYHAMKQDLAKINDLWESA